MGSQRFTLNVNDYKAWIKTVALFFAPTVLVYLLALQGGADWKFAMGSAYASLLTSTIDLLKRWVANN